MKANTHWRAVKDHGCYVRLLNGNVSAMVMDLDGGIAGEPSALSPDDDVMTPEFQQAIEDVLGVWLS